MKRLEKENYIFFLIAVVHFTISFIAMPKYSDEFNLEQEVIFFIINITSFIFITIFYQLAAQTIKAVKYKNKEVLNIAKYAFIYFIFNLLFIYISTPLLYTSDSSIIYTLDCLNSYSPAWHPSIFQFFNIVTGYFFLPFNCLGLSVFNSIIYSIIFAYCINSAEKYLSRRYFYLLFLPFCVPTILILNQIPSRMVLGAWLLLFINVYIFAKAKEKQNTSYSIIFLFAVLCAYTAILRSEYVILLLYLPALLFLLKPYPLKKFITFILIFFSCFIMFIHVKNIGGTGQYELHNLSYIFDDYIVNNKYDYDIEKNRAILNKIYADSFKISNLPSATDSFNLTNKKDTAAVISSLIKYAIKNSPHFIKKNMEKNSFGTNKSFGIPFPTSVMEEFPDLTFPIDCSPDENSIKFKIIKFILYDNKVPVLDSLLNTVFSAYTSLFLLCFIIASSVILKSECLFLFSLQWLFIVYIVMVFMFWKVDMYFFAFIFNMWICAFILLIFFLEKLSQYAGKKLNQKNDYKKELN